MLIAKRVKSVLGRILFATGLHRLFFRDRAIVAVFHRVDDRLPGDPLSCTVSEFVGHISFFKRNFEVIGLPELLRRMEAGSDLGGTLVITFDDGYLDNFTNAAPALQRLALPACFFITTGFIGSETVPWWDENLPVRCAWMTWNDVRSLGAAGFDLGAHTVNHVDLGKVDNEAAEREIIESRKQLERETGAPVTLFAYPYGGVERITDPVRDLVRRARFSCCLSAYGGDVSIGDDPFELRRFPVSSYYADPHELGFDIALSRLRDKGKRRIAGGST